MQHCLLVVMQDESDETLAELLEQYVDPFAPIAPGSLEMGMTEEMAAFDWRMRRLWAIETTMMDDSAGQQSSDAEVGRITQAFADLADRIYQRSLRTSLHPPSQKQPNEPT